MRTATQKFTQIAATLLLGLTLTGCSTGPFASHDGCGPEPGSPEWWAEQANSPPGVRSTCKKGKVWPARPRPTGEKQQFSHTYHSSHYWPLPYVCQDRAYVREIIGNQQTNGWQQATTLAPRFFDEDQQLNGPGEAKLLNVLEVTPAAYRTVYIEQTRVPEIDNIRLANVQQRVLELTQGQEDIAVQLRRGRSYLRPASEVKIINDLYNSSIPSPRLGNSSGGGAGAIAAPTGP
ncbi:MAG: hypothetical protein ABJZ55_21690 [Fuerstiella sp.]